MIDVVIYMQKDKKSKSLFFFFSFRDRHWRFKMFTPQNTHALWLLLLLRVGSAVNLDMFGKSCVAFTSCET